MPTATVSDLTLLHIATCKRLDIAAIPVGSGRYPLPLTQLIQQVISDRLALGGENLRIGDNLLLSSDFRSAISRHYYAMYHAGRAIAFAFHGGDDYQQHSVLPRNLPQDLADVAKWEVKLTDARLLRNSADYDPYPLGQVVWGSDSRQLAAVAADFLQTCEEYALSNGHI